jgi:site-specific DNA-cytosine methylase
MKLYVAVRRRGIIRVSALCILCRYRHKMHWDQCRRFSLPEFKRFSSFPDAFVFAGDFTEGIRQIGNCVPPLFMRPIALHIRTAILTATAASEPRA